MLTLISCGVAYALAGKPSLYHMIIKHYASGGLTSTVTTKNDVCLGFFVRYWFYVRVCVMLMIWKHIVDCVRVQGENRGATAV
jgi:hypothetical protein